LNPAMETAGQPPTTTKCVPRDYQLQCVEHTSKENTIVNMPTGTGKTLVASLAIDAFRNKWKALFVVPSCPLVPQQAKNKGLLLKTPRMDGRIL